jgi:outer membrane biosynthesis protein TonB
MTNYRVTAVLLLLLPAATAGGCVRAKAKTVPDVPVALDVPTPPPRDVEPSEQEPPPIIPLPQEPAHNAPARSRPSAPQPRPQEQQRSEPPKPEPAPEAETPRPEEPPRTTPLLQTSQSQNEAQAERDIKATLTRAATDLNRIDYRILNSDARTQYDTAKSFIDQAEKAVRARNLVFAKTLADKAALIATQLGGK